MATYATLAALKDAYDSGELDRKASVLVLDNDSADVFTADGEVFEAHPEDLLRAALDLLGIPWENC